MPETRPATITVDMATGRLELIGSSEDRLRALCDVAARANPKRGFLIVSKVLGRHLPTRPAAMRLMMDELGGMIDGDTPGPVVFLGMAETATALGHGVFAAFQRRHASRRSAYLQTSRQLVRGARKIASFEEGHSHATTHLVQAMGSDIEATVRSGRTLVIVDDECSTGRTFMACAEAMRSAMPELARIVTCCITDWSAGDYLDGLLVETSRHSLLGGALHWLPRDDTTSIALASGSNDPGFAPERGMRSRTGVMTPESARRSRPESRPGERILVLGEGEHSYEALLVAEELERDGAIAAIQCITRSPALLGHAIGSVSSFSDSYRSGVQCYLYNMLGHEPDRVVIVAEAAGDQVCEVEAALAKLGVRLPVAMIECRYGPTK